jgi:hypothetical protein
LERSSRLSAKTRDCLDDSGAWNFVGKPNWRFQPSYFQRHGDALTRDEHLAWCKRRALECIDAGDLTHAVAGMASDLKAHPDTDNLALAGL